MKIWTGMFGSACARIRWIVLGKIDVVNSSGAVSPAARATASTVPVRMPPKRARQNDAEHRPPAAGAEREGAFALAVRHEPQHLLCRARDERQHHDRERESRPRSPLCAWP